MFIYCYASGSAGNLYRISSYNYRTNLLIECGLKMKDIRRILGLSLNEIDAVLLTHEHMDHSKSINEILRMGIDVYTSKGTAVATKIDKNNYVHFVRMKKFLI